MCLTRFVNSEDVYTALRDAVLGRIRDKEAPVRLQAVVALAKLQKGEEGQELDEDQEDLLEILVKLLQYDPAP